MRAIFFGLTAFLVLQSPAGAAGGGPAALTLYETPSEAHWAPYSPDLPACDDTGVLSTISGRFAETQHEYWNPDLSINTFDRVREIGFRANGLDYIPRRYCVASAAMSDQKQRTVVYDVGSSFGILGLTWGVEWCVVGVDPTFAYAPDCMAIKPIIQLEIGKPGSVLGEYGLKARF